MSSPFNHPVQEIIQQVLIDIGVGTNPPDGAQWPVFAPTEPDSPDNCLTVQEYTGIETGNDALSGQVYVHYGIQVRIRAEDPTIGSIKAHAIFKAINEDVNAHAVSLGSNLYCVDSMTTAGTVNHLGLFRPEMRLELYTVNATTDIRRLV